MRFAAWNNSNWECPRQNILKKPSEKARTTKDRAKRLARVERMLGGWGRMARDKVGHIGRESDGQDMKCGKEKSRSYPVMRKSCEI